MRDRFTVLTSHIVPQPAVVQPPRALLIDLRRLILDGDWKRQPSDTQDRMLADLLGGYVKEYKPWP